MSGIRPLLYQCWCLLVALLALSVLHAQALPADKPTPSVQFGHRMGIFTVDFSPDCAYLVTGGEDWMVKVWRARTGELCHTFRMHHSSQVRAIFTPDGKSVATADAYTLIFWDVQTGKQINAIDHPQRLITSFAFSADGSLIAWATVKGEIDIVDAKTGEVRQTLTSPESFYHRLLFTRDGTRLIAGGQDRTVKVWDLQTGKILNTFFGYQGILNILKQSTDDRTLLTGDSTGQLLTLDLNTGKRIGNALSLQQGGYPEAISSDGLLVARGDTNATYLYETKTGNCVNKLSNGANECLAFSSDGKILATGSKDNAGTAWVSVIDLTTGRPLWSSTGLRVAFEQLLFTSDGKTLLTWGNNIPCYRWDMVTGRLQGVATTPNFTYDTCALSTDGNTLVAADNDKGISVLNGATGAQQRIIPSPIGNFSLAAISPDGASVAGFATDFRTRENALAVYDTRSGEKRCQVDGIERLSKLAFWPDGKTLAAGSPERIVRIFNTQTGDLLSSQHTFNPVNSLAISPSGALLAAGEGGFVEYWSYPQGNINAQLPLKKDNRFLDIYAIAISPGDDLIAVGTQQGDVELLALNTKTWVRSLTTHNEVVQAIAFSPDGKRIAAASVDGNIKISDVATGRLIADLYVLPAIANEPSWLTLTPDGYYDGSSAVKGCLSWRIGEQEIPFDIGEKQFHRLDMLRKAFSR